MKIPDGIMFELVCLQCDNTFGDYTWDETRIKVIEEVGEIWLHCDNCGYGACISGVRKGEINPTKLMP